MSQRYSRIEVSVGAFVVAGVLALFYFSVTLGGLQLKGRNYDLSARFSSIGELKPGAPVKLAGVSVGEVKRISLVEFSAEVEFALDDGLKLPDDTIASIQSAGLLGDAYVSLSPGGSDKELRTGSRITRTESAVSLTELISKYAFGSPLAEPERKERKGSDSSERELDKGLE